jgi:hypothetical protein
MLWRMASGAASPATDHALVGELDRLVRRARHHGAASLTPAELARLLRLYRHAATVVARLETSGSDPAGADRARRAAARAHGLLFRECLALMRPDAPFIQFTYAVVPPIPKSVAGVRVESSERIWMNLPPARVWIYRKGDGAKLHGARHSAWLPAVR